MMNKKIFMPAGDDFEFGGILSLDNDADKKRIESYDGELPILPLRNTVLFPGVIIPITVGREKSINAVQKANRNDKMIGVVAQKDLEIENPNKDDINTIGTIAQIVKVLDMPDGSTTVIIQGKERIQLKEITAEEPYIAAYVEVLKEAKANDTKEFTALISMMQDLAVRVIKLSPKIPDDAQYVIKNINSDSFMVHFIANNLNVEVSQKQEILETHALKQRAEKTLAHLNEELQMAQLQDKIQNKVKTDIEKQQRDYFLHQQMKTIQEELGGDPVDHEIREMVKRSKDKKWSKTVKQTFDKEIAKIKRVNPAAAEYSVLMNYLELLLDLPWEECTEDNFDLRKSKKILDRDHYGLDKIKDRILEYLAVLKLKGDMKSPILCFVGPPGVGKTSLGKSIAKSLNRSYVRMSLGGLHDESEIRGHRKTYIGAMPGRIIQSIKKAKNSNPVFILDEIDKVGKDFRGDPSSALLEVLDPEQNGNFYDNYLELEYDLSKVMFIATANNLNTIQPALRDRMEIIHLSGYSLEEKAEIAVKHLIPKQRKAHGLKAAQVKLGKATLNKMIDEYTRESGVRNLDRKIASIMRWVAKNIALAEDYDPSISPNMVEEILGKKVFDKDIYAKNNIAGVAIGLAWTVNGGDILFIESNTSNGKGNLTLTGNLGEVMKESATTALSFIKANCVDLNINPEMFAKKNIHIHVPEGAIPKDGPSAGITMMTALTSVLTGRKVKSNLAMTGEITLRGKVLPVGGIKEKVLAAKRAGMKQIILCERNRRDVEEINPSYIKGLDFHFVTQMNDVLDIALEAPKKTKMHKAV